MGRTDALMFADMLEDRGLGTGGFRAWVERLTRAPFAASTGSGDGYGDGDGYGSGDGDGYGYGSGYGYGYGEGYG